MACCTPYNWRTTHRNGCHSEVPALGREESAFLTPIQAGFFRYAHGLLHTIQLANYSPKRLSFRSARSGARGICISDAHPSRILSLRSWPVAHHTTGELLTETVVIPKCPLWGARNLHF